MEFYYRLFVQLHGSFCFSEFEVGVSPTFPLTGVLQYSLNCHGS